MKGWQNARMTDHFNVSNGLKRIARDLKNWEINTLGNLNQKIKCLKTELEEVRRKDISQEQVSRELFLREKLNRLEQQQDTYWRQRAHANWLKSGDRNTKYFHAFASERKRNNTISKLKRDDGGWVEGQANLKELIYDYFSALFTSTP